jgi:hypothetical protein
VKLSLPTRPVRLKFAGVSVAVVLPSYVFIGLPTMDAVKVFAVICAFAVALVEEVFVPAAPRV